MKTIKFFPLFILTLAFFIGCNQIAINSHDLTINGGFEDISSNGPKAWYATRLPATSGYVTFGVDKTQKQNGEQSVFISIAQSHPDRNISYNWTQAIKCCEIGARYELSGWIKTEGLNETAWIVIQCWDRENKNILAISTTQSTYRILGSSDWNFVKTAFAVPDGTAEVCIRAGISTPENIGGKVWFDEIKVEKLHDNNSGG